MKVNLDSRAAVSVEWLNKHIEAENLLVFNASFLKVTDDGHANADQRQIPHTQFFDIKKAFSDVSGKFPNTIPSEEQFQSEARKLGINDDSTIIVYDDKGIYSSARVWWLFKTFGHDNVAILDGGLPEWLRQDLPTEDKQINRKPKGDFNARFIRDNVVYFKDLETLSEDKAVTILDARSSDRFNCEVPEPRAGLRSGTIPNSKNLPYADCLKDGKLKPKTELQAIFKERVAENDTLVFSCGSGITACILDLAATMTGYEDTKVYDGSWTEYGSLTKE